MVTKLQPMSKTKQGVCWVRINKKDATKLGYNPDTTPCHKINHDLRKKIGLPIRTPAIRLKLKADTKAELKKLLQSEIKKLG